MPMRHGGSLPKNSRICPRLSCFLTTGFPAASTPCTWKTFLAISIPIVLICMWTAPSCDSSTTITLWHIDAGSGRRPPHQKRRAAFVRCQGRPDHHVDCSHFVRDVRVATRVVHWRSMDQNTKDILEAVNFIKERV